MTEDLTTGAPDGSMEEFEELHRILLRNLASHARPARGRLCLALPDAARLVGLTPDILGDIENGRGCLLSLSELTHVALSLGLTDTGAPRPQPPGMH